MDHLLFVNQEEPVNVQNLLLAKSAKILIPVKMEEMFKINLFLWLIRAKCQLLPSIKAAKVTQVKNPPFTFWGLQE